MASIIRGTANGNLELIAGTGQTIVLTNDALGSIAIDSLATQGFVTAQINNLIDSAPGALDTLNELATALGNDADFASTITTALSGKADSSTTLAGYGIIDAYTSTEVDTLLGDKANSADVYTSTEVDTALDLKQDVIIVATPTSSIGQAGDLAGQWASDGSFIYYCTADYTDGLSDIWARVALTLETW